MKLFKVIDQLSLDRSGVLVCKKPSGRSYQKAHYKQGDLDGACGAYSLSMVLNILGVFEADDIYKDSDEHDKRTVQWKLIKALNEKGLFPNGLDPEEMEEIVTRNYSKHVSFSFMGEKTSIPDVVRNSIDENVPVILEISFNKYDWHWIVAVGYEFDEKNNIIALLTLDPGSESPRYTLWNGILYTKRDSHKRYGFSYFSDKEHLINLENAIVIRKK